jgi:pilus assembly protein Flp/PilA
MYDILTHLRIQIAASKARTERGASAVEYGLLVSLIAVAIIVAVGLLGTRLRSIFENTTGSI